MSFRGQVDFLEPINLAEHLDKVELYLGQVCQMRERELVAINNQLVLRNQAAGREADQQKRAQLLAPVEQLRANLTATEASWQRMDCARVLYSR